MSLYLPEKATEILPPGELALSFLNNHMGFTSVGYLLLYFINFVNYEIIS